MDIKRISFLYVFLALIALITSCPTPASDETVQKNTEPYFVQYFQKEIFPYSAYDYAGDTYLDSLFPDSSFDGSGLLNVGQLEGINRTLIHFDIHGTFPSNAVIKKAYLTLRVIGVTKGAIVKIALLSMQDIWLESATWNNNGYYSWTGGNITGLTTIGSASVNDSISILTVEIPVNVINNWIINSNSNYGILLKNEIETSGTWVRFSSNESRILNDRPLLSVYYTLP